MNGLSANEQCLVLSSLTFTPPTHPGTQRTYGMRPAEALSVISLLADWVLCAVFGQQPQGGQNVLPDRSPDAEAFVREIKLHPACEEALRLVRSDVSYIRNDKVKH
jgi:hypothetical protein